MGNEHLPTCVCYSGALPHSDDQADADTLEDKTLSQNHARSFDLIKVLDKWKHNQAH